MANATSKRGGVPGVFIPTEASDLNFVAGSFCMCNLDHFNSIARLKSAPRASRGSWLETPHMRASPFFSKVLAVQPRDLSRVMFINFRGAHQACLYRIQRHPCKG